MNFSQDQLEILSVDRRENLAGELFFPYNCKLEATIFPNISCFYILFFQQADIGKPKTQIITIYSCHKHVCQNMRGHD